MGKIEANFFISLDGVVESPDQWHFDYFNDEMGAAIGQGTAEVHRVPDRARLCTRNGRRTGPTRATT